MFRLAPLPGDSILAERNGNSKESREKTSSQGRSRRVWKQLFPNRSLRALSSDYSQPVDSDSIGVAMRALGTGPCSSRKATMMLRGASRCSHSESSLSGSRFQAAFVITTVVSRRISVLK